MIARAFASAAVAVMLAASPVLAKTKKGEEANEKPIQMSEVPQKAMDAATTALGATPTEAKTAGKSHGKQVYELEVNPGTPQEHAVHVTADGKVLKREKRAG